MSQLFYFRVNIVRFFVSSSFSEAQIDFFRRRKVKCLLMSGSAFCASFVCPAMTGLDTFSGKIKHWIITERVGDDNSVKKLDCIKSSPIIAGNNQPFPLFLVDA